MAHSLSSSVSVGILEYYYFITLAESVSGNAGSERVIEWWCLECSASQAADASGCCTYLAFRMMRNIVLAIVTLCALYFMIFGFFFNDYKKYLNI